MAYSQADIAQKVGRVLLFCGVETYSWTPDHFYNVAAFCRQHGIDTLMVKIADGGNLWYGGWSQIDHIMTVLIGNGVGFLPYSYCYGNKYGALQTELDIVKSALSRYGYMCMDMEQEYDGQTGWCWSVHNELVSHTGILLCSTWADPQLQNWTNNNNILASTYDAFMPQEYTEYLSSTEYQLAQSGIHNMVPTVYLGSDLPGNNAGDVAQQIRARGHVSISLWYDTFAINNPGIVDFIVKLFKSTPVPAPVQKDYTHMDTQFNDVWHANQWGLPDTTGIAQGVREAFHAEKISACYPTTQEIHTVDWSGNAIIYQCLSNGCHAEYSNGHCSVYAADNTKVWG